MEPCANLCLRSSVVILGFVFSRILNERLSTSVTFQRRHLRGCDLTIAYLYIKIPIHQGTLVRHKVALCTTWLCDVVAKEFKTTTSVRLGLSQPGGEP